MIAVSPDSLCGGVSITPSQSFFRVNGKPVHRDLDLVPIHVNHISQTISSTRFFTCEGIPVSIAGDSASCGHTISGSEFVTVSG